MVTDDFINKLFEGANFGEMINTNVYEKRRLLAKTLKNSSDGYWTGHTAYHIAVDGGFLKDGKKSVGKVLTELGHEFLKDWD